jgi:hypothetical protein
VGCPTTQRQNKFPIFALFFLKMFNIFPQTNGMFGSCVIVATNADEGLERKK